MRAARAGHAATIQSDEHRLVQAQRPHRRQPDLSRRICAAGLAPQLHLTLDAYRPERASRFRVDTLGPLPPVLTRRQPQSA